MNSLWHNILAYKEMPLFRGLEVLNQYIRPAIIPPVVPIHEHNTYSFPDKELLSTLFVKPHDEDDNIPDAFHPIQMDLAESNVHLCEPSCPSPNTIRHLVLSGGGETGFSFYSALRESNQAGFWKIEEIDSIYGVSAGGVFAVVICLLPFFNWNIFDDFILKRPWQNVFSINLKTIVQSLKTQGILGISTIESIFLPLFNAIDIPIDITLAEFYEKTGIHLHIIATELPSLSPVDISHLTHPDWTVVQAVYCSSGLPMLFVPFIRDEKIYIDGGFVCNYPTKFCIDAGNDPDEILGFVRIYCGITDLSSINSLTDYLYYLIGNLFAKLMNPHVSVKNELAFHTKDPFANIIYTIYKAASDYAFRVSLQEEGVNVWRDFYAKTYPDDIETEPNPDEPE